MRGVCNQTWLNPPMDGCKGYYITKLKKKEKEKHCIREWGKEMMLGQKLFTIY
jgi:hypothetical protein